MDVSEEKVKTVEGAVWRMLKNIKKRVPTKLSPEEAVLIVQLLGFGLEQMRIIAEETIKESDDGRETND